MKELDYRSERKLELVNAMKKSIRIVTFCFGAVWTYILVVFFLDQMVFGFHFGFTELLFTVALSLVFIKWGVQWLVRQRIFVHSGLRDIGLMAFVMMLCVTVVDISYSAYLTTQTSDNYSAESRLIDPHLWIGEMYPRLYYPTEENFRLHKPNFTVKADHYGTFYSPGLMKSPTLSDSVFRLKTVTISINEKGFREKTPLERSEIFLLGDSFAFGWGVSDELTCSDMLERAIGEPVYNLGIHDSSPKQELMLLEDLLENSTKPPEIRHLLWLIYEGNDLEDSYETFHADFQAEKDGLGYMFKETVVMHLRNITYAVQNQAVAHLFRTGQIKVSLPFSGSPGSNGSNPYMVDKIKLLNPLYYSPDHGYRLFNQPYVETACQPLSYLMNHPHRPLLDKVFLDMASLAEKYRFEVTVVIVPTCIRLYAPYYENFPSITAEPHFINYVSDLSRRTGFETVNLLSRMRPYADRELLYFSDDDHWNERGNEVAAEILTSDIFDL